MGLHRLFLKARHALGPGPEDEGRRLMDDLDMVAAIARRARRRRRQGVLRRLLPPERQEVPRLARPERALEHRDEILRLLRECDGSFLRVHEELTKAGAARADRQPRARLLPDALLPGPPGWLRTAV